MCVYLYIYFFFACVYIIKNVIITMCVRDAETTMLPIFAFGVGAGEWHGEGELLKNIVFLAHQVMNPKVLLLRRMILPHDVGEKVIWGGGASKTALFRAPCSKGTYVTAGRKSTFSCPRHVVS